MYYGIQGTAQLVCEADVLGMHQLCDAFFQLNADGVSCQFLSSTT